MKKSAKQTFSFLLVVIMLLCCSATSLAAEKQYGKIGSRQFYYSLSANKSTRVERSTKKITKTDDLKKLAKGTLKLTVSLLGDTVPAELTIPGSVFEDIVGLGNSKTMSITSKSYSTYVFELDYKTRSIYAYSDQKNKKGKRVSLKDESGKLDVFYEFHPVGTGWKKSTYSYKIKSGMTLKNENYDKKSSRLSTANSYFNHKATWIESLVPLTFSDSLVKK